MLLPAQNTCIYQNLTLGRRKFGKRVNLQNFHSVLAASSGSIALLPKPQRCVQIAFTFHPLQIGYWEALENLQ